MKDLLTVRDRAVPVGDGCVARNTASDVLEMMEQLVTEVMPVLRSFQDRAILGLVDRRGLARVVESDDAEAARVSDAPWFDAPMVSADEPLPGVLESPHPPSLYVVVDADRELVGVLRPGSSADATSAGGA